MERKKRLLEISGVCGIRSVGRIAAEIAEDYEAQGWECKIAYGRLDVPEKYQKYAVKIGDQIWMAENLNYVDSLLKRNWCYYPNDCKTFGRHYSWHDAVADDKKKNPVRGICPEGWHIPDTTEWKTFFAAVNSSVYSIQAKALGKWTKSTDATGFSVIPVGFQFYSNRLEEQGSETHFWSANECDYNTAYGKAYSWVLTTDRALFGYDDIMEAGNSVRCVKDFE